MQAVSGSLIAVLESNDPEKEIFPGTTSQAEILYTEADGENRVVFEVPKVDFRNFGAGPSEILFSLNGSAVNNWKVTVTKQRVTVWNAASWGLLGPMGKAKVKSGRASGGQLKYGAIVKISTFIESGNAVLILVSGKANPKILRGFTLSGNVDEMRLLLNALHQALDRWLIDNGRKLDGDSSDQKQQKCLSDWETFLDRAWASSDKEVTVQVPSVRFDILP